MKLAIASMLVSLSFASYGQGTTIDEYSFCEAAVGRIKAYAVADAKSLTALRKQISFAQSIDQLDEAISFPYLSGVQDIMSHQGVSEHEAKQIALGTLKEIEINYINQAIQFQGMSGESFWSMVYSNCVRRNKQ